MVPAHYGTRQHVARRVGRAELLKGQHAVPVRVHVLLRDAVLEADVRHSIVNGGVARRLVLDAVDGRARSSSPSRSLPRGEASSPDSRRRGSTIEARLRDHGAGSMAMMVNSS